MRRDAASLFREMRAETQKAIEGSARRRRAEGVFAYFLRRKKVGALAVAVPPKFRKRKSAGKETDDKFVRDRPGKISFRAETLQACSLVPSRLVPWRGKAEL